MPITGPGNMWAQVAREFENASTIEDLGKAFKMHCEAMHNLHADIEELVAEIRRVR